MYTHTEDTHTTLNMDRLDERWKKHVSVQMHKFLNCNSPASCRSMFTYMSDYHTVNTRSAISEELLVPKVNLTMTQRNIRYFGTKIWNEIPQEIKVQPSLDLFKERFYAFKF